MSDERNVVVDSDGVEVLDSGSPESESSSVSDDPMAAGVTCDEDEYRLRRSTGARRALFHPEKGKLSILTTANAQRSVLPIQARWFSRAVLGVKRNKN